MRFHKFLMHFSALLLLPLTATAQNCCAPTVPQQGVMGETVALPHTLEIGLHTEMLRSRDYYEGSEQVENTQDVRTDWYRTTLSASYSLNRRTSLSLLAPFTKKSWSRDKSAGSGRVEASSTGFGDIILLGRWALIPRDWVNMRELSFGFGVKMPTGNTDARSAGLILEEAMQPGTGTWDILLSGSYYEEFGPLQAVVSASYLITSTGTGRNDLTPYKFGNEFSFLISSNARLGSRASGSLALTGIAKGQDQGYNLTIPYTGREQVWVVPGVQYQVIPETMSAHLYFEWPVYQHFNGTQLGSEFNLRLSLIYAIPLGSE